MATIVLASYMFRYPLGGMNSWVLQYLLGLKALKHDVYFVEKYGYANSCYNPEKETMSDDCSYGLKLVSALLKRFDLESKWCFVARDNGYYGLSEQRVNEVFRSADLFIDMGSHGSWEKESNFASLKVLIDGEPGYTQIKLAEKMKEGLTIPQYDRYFTNGKNIGNPGNVVPTLGLKWEHVYNPVTTALFPAASPVPNAPYSTVMNWKSHDPVMYNGIEYGQKDVEFQKFLDLPKYIHFPLEAAVSGKNIPVQSLIDNGWIIKNGKAVTRSFDDFRNYLYACRGEFSVCKNVFVATNTGWFSDKSAAFLACCRPVILQDTGFSKHLPVGMGLFAINNMKEAKEALFNIESNYSMHSRAAREIACEYLESKKVMKQFLNELGI
jgi:hypothetical protein